MKTKKALRKLEKVETLLSSIIEQYDTDGQHSLRQALDSAKESVIHARDTVNHDQSQSKTVRKAAGKASSAAPDATGLRGRRKVRAAAAS